MQNKDRFFSIELKSKSNLKNITLTNGGQESALIEGTIGPLQQAKFADDVVLEVVGSEGILRVNLTPNEIKQKNSR